MNVEAADVMSQTYFTKFKAGTPVRFGYGPSSIDVVGGIDDPISIGTASLAGHTDRGYAMWRLRVHGVDVPGRWVIIDRRFVKVKYTLAVNRWAQCGGWSGSFGAEWTSWGGMKLPT